MVPPISHGLSLALNFSETSLRGLTSALFFFFFFFPFFVLWLPISSHSFLIQEELDLVVSRV